MSAFLFGVPGKLKTLLDRLTSTRASNLDNLDTSVSSRAPASTALNSGVWTSTRAGYLDVLPQLQLRGDPRMLPLQWMRPAGWTFSSDGANAYDLTQSAFWTSVDYIGYPSASVSANDSYVTVLDVSSGRGVVTAVIGPAHAATGYTTTFRITVDGRVYTISGTFSGTPNNARLGLVVAEPLENSWGPAGGQAINGIGQDDANVIVRLAKPEHALAWNLGYLLYTSSCKVEVKISTMPAAGDLRKCLVVHRAIFGSVA